MAAPLLRTKLYTPPSRPDAVRRPRLVHRLAAGFGRGNRLTLISAPAGFGKTTLLCEWIASCERPFGWLSLDEGDNDPLRFWAYVVAALRMIDEWEDSAGSEAEVALGALRSPQPAQASTFITGLINQVGLAQDHFALVLDDYHLITSQAIHDGLAFLLDHLPNKMHLVIATRADPPLPIARLRGRGQLTELRRADLRFTLDEASGFLGRIMGLKLTAADVGALAARTEGWITGLQMAAASMQGREDVSGFVTALTGSHRYILDYLVEEVLQRQPPQVQAFLFLTSVLGRLSAPLCEAICSVRASASGGKEVPAELFLSQALWGGEGGAEAAPTDAQSRLDMLDRANLFIVPLDDERRWYRYHRLFRDLLLKRLQQMQPDLVPVLHRRASEWYEQHGLASEAIDHALSGEDYSRAVDLVERCAESTLMRSEVVTLLQWVDKLPDELVRSRPALCLYHAWTLLLAGRPLESIEGRLQHAEKAASLRALIAVYRGQISRAIEQARLGLEQLTEEDRFLRGLATWIMGLVQLADGDLEAGSQALDEVVRMSREMGNVMFASAALSHVAKLQKRRGQLQQAKATYERALALATDTLGRPVPIAGEALMGLGELWREWNDLETATSYLTQGIELSRGWSEVSAFDGYIPLARVRQARGDENGAWDAVREAQQLALKTDSTELDDLAVDMFAALLSTAQGDVEAAMRWAEERGVGTDAAGGDPESRETFLNAHLRKYERLVLARALIKQDRPGEALAVLEQLLPRMEGQGRTDLVIEIQVLRALAAQAQGSIERALGALESALSLAEPGGYVRMFVDEGEPMARLLHQAAARGIAPEYSGRLLAAFELQRIDQGLKAPTGPSSPLVEPLSPREVEVLKLLAAGLSNKEIAERLVIAVGTVKKHLKNIYGKLGVHSRTMAVARGRDVGLL